MSHFRKNISSNVINLEKILKSEPFLYAHTEAIKIFYKEKLIFEKIYFVVSYD